MRSVKHQRIFSVVLGFGLLIMGSFFVLPLMVAAYMLGLMLIGFGVEPRMSDDSLGRTAPAMPRPAAKMSAAPKKKAKPKARKKPARRKR